MRREQKQHGAVRLVGGEPFQALVDMRFPIVAGRKPLLVEPDLVATRPQVVPEPARERSVFVMPVAEKHALRNERLLGLEIFFAAPFIVIVTQYAPVLITRLGATPLLIGAFTSGPALMTAAMAAIGPRYIEWVPSFRWSVGVPAVLWRMLLVVIPMALFLPTGQPETIVLGAMVLSLGAGLTNFTVPAYFPRFTLPERLGRMVSQRWTLLGIGMTISTPLLGFLLDKLTLPYNYVLICGIGIVTTAVGITLLMLVRVAATQKENARKTLSFAELRQHPASVRYLCVALLMQFSLNAAGPLITLRMVRGLGASDGDFGWYYAIFWIVLAFMGFVTARITERWGNRLTFGAAALALAAQLIVLALATNLQVTWIAATISGFASVLFQVSAYGLLVDHAPAGRYEGFTGWNTVVANIAILVAPMVMTSLVSLGMDSATGLIICGALRAMSGIAAIAFLRPQSVASTRPQQTQAG